MLIQLSFAGRNVVDAKGSEVRNYGRICGIAFVSALLSSHPVYAQVVLETVVVEGSGSDSAIGPGDGYIAQDTTTGSKTDTPLIEIPESVSVVTQKELED